MFNEKVYEFRLVLAERFGFGQKIKEGIEISRDWSLLWLAFKACDRGLGRDTFTRLSATNSCLDLSRFVLYYGTQNKFINIILKGLLKVRNKLRNKFEYGH